MDYTNLAGKAASCSPSIVLLCKEDVGQFAVCISLQWGVGLLILVIVQIIQIQRLGALVLCGGNHHQARLERLQGGHIAVDPHILGIVTVCSTPIDETMVHLCIEVCQKNYVLHGDVELKADHRLQIHPSMQSLNRHEMLSQ